MTRKKNQRSNNDRHGGIKNNYMDKRILIGGILGSVLLGIILLFVFQSDSSVPLGGGGGFDLNRVSSSTITATTTSNQSAVLVLPRSNTRLGARIVNDSDTVIYIHERNYANTEAASTTVVRNAGTRVNANGGSLELLPELLWIMSGSTNAKDLHQYGTKLWDKWAKATEEKIGYTDGELGPIYGHQLRNFTGTVDQLTQVRGMLKRDSRTRRAMISFWNLGDVEKPNGEHVVDVAPCITLLHF